jgi:hypothetical protein
MRSRNCLCDVHSEAGDRKCVARGQNPATASVIGQQVPKHPTARDGVVDHPVERAMIK